MEKSRLEIKVGLFVCIGLALVVALMVWFSKGHSLFRSTYELKLHTANIGGLKLQAGVLLAGVNVGTVEDIRLDPSGTDCPSGTSVTVLLRIYNKYRIYHDARFVIKSSDFLGDQYVAVIPLTNSLPVLINGADVQCDAPFDLQEVEGDAGQIMKDVRDTMQDVKATLKKVTFSIDALQAKVLNAEALGSLMTNVHDITVQAKGTLSDLDNLIATNQTQVSLAVSNFARFSAQLNQLGISASNLLATNGDNLTAATKNIQNLTANADQLVKNAGAGQGLVGELLRNNQTATNVQLLAENLSVVSSNLNRFGLWHILWSHSPPDTNTVKPVTLQSPPRRQ